MKSIVVRNQVRLGPGRCLGLTLSGMAYRLFRALITVAILTLAVAFLAHVISYNLWAHSTRTHAYRELERTRVLGAWTTRLNRPDPRTTVIEHLARSGSSDRVRSYRAWATGVGVSRARFAGATEIAARLTRAWRALDQLSQKKRVAVLAGMNAREIGPRLQEEDAFEQFVDRLKDADARPPLGSLEAFRELIREQWPKLDEVVAAVRRGHRSAIAEVRDRIGAGSILAAFAQQPRRLAEATRDAGFALGDAELERLERQARRRQGMERLAELLRKRDGIDQAFRQRGDYAGKRAELDEVLMWLSSTARARWLHERLGGPEELAPDRLRSLAHRYRRNADLRAAVGDERPQQRGGLFGLPSRTRWLIAVSFLVCIVGVANAMFMSVTERFAEIATMKCLGALDGFVMLMFLFESLIQGLVGGVAGVLVGGVLALLRMVLNYGALSFEAVPGLDLLTVAGLSMATGMILAAVAAIGPAWVASRLAPMEAMRIE